jgi:hypothetical protein
MARKPNKTVQLKLRFAESLRRRLEREAVRNKRSMNSEIVSRLERSFEPPPFDLYSMLKNAHEAVVAKKFSPRGHEALCAVVDPLAAALMQIWPDLDYVRIALLPEEGHGFGGHVDSFSAEGWKRFQRRS